MSVCDMAEKWLSYPLRPVSVSGVVEEELYDLSVLTLCMSF